MNDNNKHKWQFTSTELKKALDSWADLSARLPEPTADEQMIQDMQKLLKDLQIKIQELSSDSAR
jgi:hypothetical protein